MIQKQLIKIKKSKYLFNYFWTNLSYFRLAQNEFVKIASKMTKNSIVEIGAEKQYNHGGFFNPDISYIPTNFHREAINVLDVTNISYADNTVDNYLCVSVLEHVKEINKAILEIHRTLKPGGKLFFVIPFGYPVHDEKDYWRLAPDAYLELFDGFKILKWYNLGGKLSSCSESLQRPRGKITFRYFLYKLIGFQALILSYLIERVDDMPLGYGLILEKNN